MADYTIKSGDTWPPITITLTETALATDTTRYTNPKFGQTGEPQFIRRVDLFTTPPDSIRMIAKLTSPSTEFDGAMENVEVIDTSGTMGTVVGTEPGLNVPANRGQVRYPFSDGDTDTPGAGYALEVEVTWDAGSSPPKVETFPNQAAVNPTLNIDADLG